MQRGRRDLIQVSRWGAAVSDEFHTVRRRDVRQSPVPRAIPASRSMLSRTWNSPSFRHQVPSLSSGARRTAFTERSEPWYTWHAGRDEALAVGPLEADPSETQPRSLFRFSLIFRLTDQNRAAKPCSGFVGSNSMLGGIRTSDRADPDDLSSRYNSELLNIGRDSHRECILRHNRANSGEL